MVALNYNVKDQERVAGLLARARRRQLELAIAGRVRESAIYAARVERILDAVTEARDEEASVLPCEV